MQSRKPLEERLSAFCFSENGPPVSVHTRDHFMPVQAAGPSGGVMRPTSEATSPLGKKCRTVPLHVVSGVFRSYRNSFAALAFLLIYILQSHQNCSLQGNAQVSGSGRPGEATGT